MSSACAKCGNRMEEGFTIDSGDYSVPSIAAWHGGKPQKSVWLGLKTDKAAKREIVSWRCTKCGFLENYAR